MVRNIYCSSVKNLSVTKTIKMKIKSPQKEDARLMELRTETVGLVLAVDTKKILKNGTGY